MKKLIFVSCLIAAPCAYPMFKMHHFEIGAATYIFAFFLGLLCMKIAIRFHLGKEGWIPASSIDLAIMGTLAFSFVVPMFVCWTFATYAFGWHT